MAPGEKPYICYEGKRYRDTRCRLEDTYGEGNCVLVVDAEQIEPGRIERGTFLLKD